MLENVTARHVEKAVHIRTCNPHLDRLLATIIREWHYQTTDAPGERTLVIVEEGCATLEEYSAALWLSRSTYAARGRLQIPIAIQELYGILERRFHNPPRRHLRLTLDLPCRMQLQGEWGDVNILSLSDRGCRIGFDRELTRDQPLRLSFSVAGQLLDLAGSVIYAMPRYSGDRQANFDIGVIFSGQGALEREILLDFIISTYFVRARGGLPEEVFNTALDYFQLNAKVRRRLQLAGALT